MSNPKFHDSQAAAAYEFVQTKINQNLALEAQWVANLQKCVNAKHPVRDEMTTNIPIQKITAQTTVYFKVVGWLEKGYPLSQCQKWCEGNALDMIDVGTKDPFEQSLASAYAHVADQLAGLLTT